MNLIEAFKQIGRDIRDLTTRSKKIETDTATKIQSIEKLEWLKSEASWVAIFEELKNSEIGAPLVNLPFYIVRDKQTNSLFFKGLDRPPFFRDQETGEIKWKGLFEWEYQINSNTVLGFYMQQFTTKEEWNDYNDSLNKEQGLERTIVSKNINEDDEIATNGLWYVDDDGHFQRLVDTVIELKKEIAELKGNKNHE